MCKNSNLRYFNFHQQFQMAYGLHPQLYPYLYAPKNPLSLPSSYDSSESVTRHKSNKEKDDVNERSNHDESSSVKGDEDCAIDESENVEID